MNETHFRRENGSAVPEDTLTPISDLLSQLREETRGSGKPVTLGMIADALRDRSFGAFLLVFAAPNLLPLPPGTSTVLGLPLIFIAWQMAIGRSRIHLAGFLARRGLSPVRFEGIISRILPWIRRSETLVKPRYWPLPSYSSNRVVGFLVLFLSLLVLIPIPLGNWLPAFAIALLGVALSERDGFWLFAGLLVGAAGAAVIVLLFFAAGQIAEEVMN